MVSVGSATEKHKKCVPFVSQYSDCIDENQCGGCSKCTCTAKGTWSCEKVNKCEKMFERAPVNDNDIDVALLMMESAMKQERKKAASSSKYQFVPMPSTENSLLLEVTTEKEFNIEDDIMDLLRPKRSVAEPKDIKNASVKFYHTVDEVNEDTLKNTNESGTIKVKKLEVDLPKLSRRAGGLLPDNTSNPLHIEYNKADVYQHINDNKILVDATPHHEDLIHEVLANYSQKQKDRDVSKVIVKEMKSGTEIIGDKNAPIMSNVSFTPENETFVAMTYIAGNLLNKLWNMETDSSETIETELLKHERIAELLDLFKEPLSINQEMLLKNAIEQLSSVIDKNKDLKNVSLCHQLGEVKEFLNNANFSEEKNCNKDKTKDTEAASNVDNVINLVKKLKNVQSHMDTLKTPKEQVETKDFETQKDSGFGKYANTPINLLGSLFEGVTKLLLPSNNGKKLSNRMRNLHIFGKDYEFSNRFKNIFNIALGNITMTTKDKIVLDYLTHIDNSPDCLLHGKRPKTKPKAPTNIEGNILLNLSEFFKMKSLSDLLQMLGKDNKTNITNKKDKNNAVFRSQYTTETITEATTVKTQIIKADTNKLTATKEKLKMHLKTILEDLVEMQNAKDVTKKTDIKLTDVLPCIYNILNADRPVDNTNGKDNSIDKLSGIFTNLKQELKFASYRRSNTIRERPKSAIVWERLVKNLNEKQKLTRRTMNEIYPKSVIELKNMIEALESSSNTYKNIAILTNVPPHEKLTLLKTLDADIKKYIVTLENIKKSLQAGIIPNNKIAEFNEFVDNMANVININGKVLKKLSRPKFRPLNVENIETKQKLNRFSYNLAARQEYTLPKEPVAFNTKITRDQVINQLIKNRINTYIRIKEATGTDLSDDINYDIAKKILLYLEGGNNMLARELYNIFANRQKLSNGVSGANSGSTKIDINKYSGPAAILDKEPLIQFEEPKRRANFPSQNHLIQQLINMKNMGM